MKLALSTTSESVFSYRALEAMENRVRSEESPEELVERHDAGRL